MSAKKRECGSRRPQQLAPGIFLRCTRGAGHKSAHAFVHHGVVMTTWKRQRPPRLAEQCAT